MKSVFVAVIAIAILVTGVFFLSKNFSSKKTEYTKTSGYTMDEVVMHNNASSCWSVISNTVYDLTEWLNLHPGGAEKILPICGTDGTAAFAAQHQTNAEAQTELPKHAIGELVN